MAFTYDTTLATVPHQLRFLVQDTVDTGHFLEDEEIAFVSGSESNINRAAANLCRAIAGKILAMPGFDDRQIVFDPEAKAEQYMALAKAFDKKADQASVLDISGDAFTANILGINGEDLGEPAFTRALHITPESES